MKKKVLLISIIIGLLGLALSSCAAPASVEENEPQELLVMTHDSFAISEEIVLQFEEQHHAKVIFIKGGDTGAALNTAILNKQSPLADVFFGVDNTFLTRALEEELFIPYESPELANIAEEFKLDPENGALPMDYGDVCINYDIAYFGEKNLSVPQSLDDLLKPEYQGLLVVESPATSSPGLAFLLATIAEFGEEGYLDFWKALRDNDVVVVLDWETAYYSNFSASAGVGPQPMVVSYASSPVAEVIFAEEVLDTAPTGSVIGKNTCFRQIEFIGILQGTQKEALAQEFIDFMLSSAAQEDIPMQNFMFPVNITAELPESFSLHAQIPENPAKVAPALISEKREEWIEAWDEIVLR
ncbi:MAG: thiamine ABC transporter substrate-binding protein [Anaerolineaceae bacterium]|nr:thiamine ABC transporter substrate-binding protein [Anaerolineaceae bacterium]